MVTALSRPAPTNRRRISARVGRNTASGRGRNPPRLLRGAALGALLWPQTWAGTLVAAEQTLWGYGVRGCPDYVAAVAAADAGAAAELQRYEDWLTGFVSALNLALGEDVLRDSGPAAALRGARDYCRQHDNADFFNAAMDQLQAPGSLR